MLTKKIKNLIFILSITAGIVFTPHLQSGTPIQRFEINGSLEKWPPIIIDGKIVIDEITYDRLVSLLNTVYSQAISYGKFAVGFSFAVIGGLVIKHGCESLGYKEKEKAARIQIASGVAMTIAGLIFMYLQGNSPKIPTQLHA